MKAEIKEQNWEENLEYTIIDVLTNEGYINGIEACEVAQKIVAKADYIFSFVKQEEREKVRNKVLKMQETVTQFGLNPEDKLGDEKTQLINKGRAFGYTEALHEVIQSITEEDGKDHNGK